MIWYDILCYDTVQYVPSTILSAASWDWKLEAFSTLASISISIALCEALLSVTFSFSDTTIG